MHHPLIASLSSTLNGSLIRSFVSAIHVPESRSNVVVSGGGESTLQVFDWTTGALLRRIEIFPAVLNYRRVRTAARKIKNKKRAEAAALAAASGPAASDDPTSEGFCVPPPGMQYPVGLNVCIERIDSVVVDGKTVVVFFSEGCTAVHALVLPEGDEEVAVHSFPTSHPVLGFSRVPGSTSQLVVALDPTYGVKKDSTVEEGLSQKMFTVVDVAADGKVSSLPTALTNSSSPTPQPLRLPSSRRLPRPSPLSRLRRPSPPSRASSSTPTSACSLAGPGSRRTRSSPAPLMSPAHRVLPVPPRQRAATLRTSRRSSLGG